MSPAAKAEPAEGDVPGTVEERLVAVRAKIERVAKDGQHGQGYSYARWEDVVEAVRGHLNDAGLHLHLSVRPGTLQTLAPGLVAVELDFAWIDVANGEQLSGVWAGMGWDKGDKALSKAYSGALKYLLLDTFLIPAGIEPEDGEQAPEDGSAAAGRQPAPTIPTSRAERMRERITAKGISTPLVTAKLADLGAGTLTALDVDQAEAMDAFIEAERGQS